MNYYQNKYPDNITSASLFIVNFLIFNFYSLYFTYFCIALLLVKVLSMQQVPNDTIQRSHIGSGIHVYPISSIQKWEFKMTGIAKDK